MENIKSGKGLHAAGQAQPAAKEELPAADYEQIRQACEKAAVQGQARAQYILGYLYYTGRGAERDYEQARRWWEKAAARNNTDAMLSLGSIYADGTGVSRDPALARQWYAKAAA